MIEILFGTRNNKCNIKKQNLPGNLGSVNRQDNHMKINKYNYIQQLKLRNEDALMYVIDHYGGLLKSVICKHLNTTPDAAEECLNDVLLSIWKHAASYDETKNSFGNWAAAIAKYKAIDYLRKYRQKSQPVDIDNVALPTEDALLASLVEQELSEETEELLSCLDERDRSLFLKLYIEEKSMEEVSRETGLVKSVIYNRLSRAKKRIRKQFRERKA